VTSRKSFLVPFNGECSGHRRKAVKQGAEESGQGRVAPPSLVPGEKKFSLNLNKLTKSSRRAAGFISDNNLKLCGKRQDIQVAQFLLTCSWIVEVHPGRQKPERGRYGPLERLRRLRPPRKDGPEAAAAGRQAIPARSSSETNLVRTARRSPV